MTIRTALDDALAARGVSAEQFSELMIRLLDHGVLCRDENKREAEFYDRYLQVADLVEDYLTVLRIRLLHEPRFHSLRLFPPGAEVPGLADSDDAFNSGLRERLSQAEVALILVLRAEYDKSLREGQIDENGQVTLPLEALSLAHKNLLGQLRIIRYAGDEALEDSESWLTIRADITSLVSDTVLAELADAGEPAGNDAPSPEEDSP